MDITIHGIRVNGILTRDIARMAIELNRFFPSRMSARAPIQKCVNLKLLVREIFPTDVPKINAVKDETA